MMLQLKLSVPRSLAAAEASVAFTQEQEELQTSASKKERIKPSSFKNRRQWSSVL